MVIKKLKDRNTKVQEKTKFISKLLCHNKHRHIFLDNKKKIKRLILIFI